MIFGKVAWVVIPVLVFGAAAASATPCPAPVNITAMNAVFKSDLTVLVRVGNEISANLFNGRFQRVYNGDAGTGRIVVKGGATSCGNHLNNRTTYLLFGNRTSIRNEAVRGFVGEIPIFTPLGPDIVGEAIEFASLPRTERSRITKLDMANPSCIEDDCRFVPFPETGPGDCPAGTSLESSSFVCRFSEGSCSWHQDDKCVVTPGPTNAPTNLEVKPTVEPTPAVCIVCPSDSHPKKYCPQTLDDCECTRLGSKKVRGVCRCLECRFYAGQWTARYKDAGLTCRGVPDNCMCDPPLFWHGVVQDCVETCPPGFEPIDRTCVSTTKAPSPQPTVTPVPSTSLAPTLQCAKEGHRCGKDSSGRECCDDMVCDIRGATFDYYRCRKDCKMESWVCSEDEECCDGLACHPTLESRFKFCLPKDNPIISRSPTPTPTPAPTTRCEEEILSANDPDRCPVKPKDYGECFWHNGPNPCNYEGYEA